MAFIPNFQSKDHIFRHNTNNICYFVTHTCSTAVKTLHNNRLQLQWWAAGEYKCQFYRTTVSPVQVAMSPWPVKTMSTAAGRPLSFTCNNIDNNQQNHSERDEKMYHTDGQHDILPPCNFILHSRLTTRDLWHTTIQFLQLIVMVSCTRQTDSLNPITFLRLPISYSSRSAM